MNEEEIIAQARAQERAALDEAAGKRLLAGRGIAVPRFVVAGADDDLDALLAGIVFPVVCKIMSPEVLHKSDIGGVAVGLRDVAEVAAARARMLAGDALRAVRIDGFLIEEMAPAGLELVVGGLRDPWFGPMLMVGLGGVFVEVLEDVAFRICPIEAIDAREMLDELAGAALLDGCRGQPAVSRDAIVDVLLRVGGADGLLMALREDIAEADINPLIVSQHGAVAADARFILAPRDRDR
jgi:succinyl-CoA synthetase beta subunit